MNKVQNIVEMLMQRFNENGWSKLEVEMFNGDMIEIIPCSQLMDDITKPEQVEWYLVNSSKLPWMGGESLEYVATEIANYERLLNEQKECEANLRAYFEENIKDKDFEPEAWSFYSDWHKDVTGHRPRGIACDV